MRVRVGHVHAYKLDASGTTSPDMTLHTCAGPRNHHGVFFLGESLRKV